MKNKDDVLTIMLIYLIGYISLGFLIACSFLQSFSPLSFTLVLINIITFLAFSICYIKYKVKSITRYKNIYIFLIKALYLLFNLCLIFIACLLNDSSVFMSPKNISIYIYSIELLIFIIINLDIRKVKKIFKTKDIFLKYIFVTSNQIDIKKPKKISVFSLLSFAIVSISLSLICVGGSLTKSGSLETFVQKITYYERNSDSSIYLSFQNPLLENKEKFFNISKSFRDLTYHGHWFYAPVVRSEFDNKISIIDENNKEKNIQTTFLSFYSFDAYVDPNTKMWSSSYSGLTYIGKSNLNFPQDTHPAFISNSLAAKLMDIYKIETIEEVVGKTFDLNIGESDYRIFVSNITLNDSKDYLRYSKNYGDFIVLRKNDQLLDSDETQLHFYLSGSTTYNKDALVIINRLTKDIDGWDIFSNGNFQNLSNLPSLFNNDFPIPSIVLLGVGLSIMVSYLSFCYFRSGNCVKVSKILFRSLFLLFLVQAILYFIWQYLGNYFIPVHAVLFCFLLIGNSILFLLNNEKEEEKCDISSDRRKHISLSI